MFGARSVVNLQNVSVSFGDQLVLNDISAEIKVGEWVYLVGRTGAGKSTFMKLIYADCQPDFGTVHVGAYAVHELDKKEIPFLRRKLGIVFQDFQLLPNKTVNENIIFALKASGWRSRSSMKEKLNDVLIRVGMTGKGKAYPYQLSGGEQQRISIARALINDPIVILADEPTGNLDPIAGMEIMRLLQEINKDGTSIVIVTHDYPLIQKFPSRIIEIKDGKTIKHDDSTMFLLNSPLYK